jgi:two-component system copper resistance phosphate regulon response regulator CusR
MKILIVEDEPKTGSYLKLGLTQAGFTVHVATDGWDGLDQALNESYDLIVLDVMLPGLDGWEVIRRLRKERKTVQVLFLTARDEVDDRVKGLELGADDYLVKPFAFDELLARLRAVSRREPLSHGIRLTVADLSLDPGARDVRRGGEPLALTRTEYSLLEFLMRRAGHVVPRRTLIEGVWGHDRDIEENTLDAFVRLLRQKVDAGDRPRLIHTVRGVGYVLREASKS